MIGSLVLAGVLFVTASLGWGLVFHWEKTGVARKTLLLIYFFVTASAVFSSIFLLKGFGDEGLSPGIIIDSLAFSLGFILSLICGFMLASIKRIAGAFVFLEGVWKSESREKDRDEEVDEIMERINRTNEIDPLERELIGSILKFKDKTVREVMVPRGDIVAIDVEEDPRRLLRRVAQEGYSRMPVYSGSIDNVVGIIYAKDLIPMAEGGGAIVLQDILRVPYYVPESKKIGELLREMQRNKVHLAIVVDEFGGTEGIITLEDVLEEIVGEIQDEYDESLSELIQDVDGNMHLSGSMSVDRFNELIEMQIPREDDYDTVAGFVQKLAGKIPQKGEVYNYGEMFFVVEEVARHRIKWLKVSFKEHPRIPESAEVAAEKVESQVHIPEVTDSPVETEPVPTPKPKRKGSSQRGTGAKSSHARKPPERSKSRKGSKKDK